MNKLFVLLLMVCLTGCKLEAKYVEIAMHSCDKNGGVDYFMVDDWNVGSRVISKAYCNDGMTKSYPSEETKP